MHIYPLRRGIYNHRADRIEKTLSSLELPARVQGGEVGTNRVRYHLAPLPDMPSYRIREIASKVAEAMGVYKVHLDEMEDGWVLDMPLEEGISLRLLPLMEGLNNLLPLTAVLGITASGKPMLLNLRRSKAWHLFVYGPPNAGKSELLRTLIFSLALKNRPSQIQFLGIDLTGKELTVMDALPHALSEVAVDAGYAEEVICWLADEVERRKEVGVIYPDVMLIIDELESVMHHSEMLLKKLPMILKDGLKAGVHLIATSKEIRPGSFLPNWRRSGIVLAKAGGEMARSTIRESERGQFEFQVCGERIGAQVAWLTVHDIQEAVTMVCTGYPSNGYAVDLKMLWK